MIEPLILARIQYAFTVSFHIIFPAFTIGLASWLAVVEILWLKTRQVVYKEIYLMWIKIFAICFGMGVVSGIVMAYQFGTNWSVFSDKIGNVIGPLLGFEVFTAFFLEASFLGVMLFGWGRVSEKMHFVSTCIVAIGTLISAFWILSANSWMQTPSGFEIKSDGLFYPTSWLKIIFNPSFPYRLLHMLTAAYLTTAFSVGGVAAYFLYKNKYLQHARIMFAMAMLMAIFVAPLQLLIGDQHGLNTFKHQPRKIAAIEGIWDTGKSVGFHLFAIPNKKEQKNDYELTIPKLGSLLLTHSLDGEIKGLKEWAINDQPPVFLVFWAFRIMVGIGLAMILTGLIAIFLYYQKRLFNTRWFQIWCMLMTPTGFIAVLSGWFVTEIGRQPYTVYGILRTSDSHSPLVIHQVAISLIAFIVIYSLIFGTACYLIIKLIKSGPEILNNDSDDYYNNSITKSINELTTSENKL